MQGNGVDADLVVAAPPSAIVEAIQSTGRDAILRGSGASNSRWSLPRFCTLDSSPTALSCVTVSVHGKG